MKSICRNDLHAGPWVYLTQKYSLFGSAELIDKQLPISGMSVQQFPKLLDAAAVPYHWHRGRLHLWRTHRASPWLAGSLLHPGPSCNISPACILSPPWCSLVLKLLWWSDQCVVVVQAAAALPLVLWTLLAPSVALHMAEEPEEASSAAAAGPHALPTCGPCEQLCGCITYPYPGIA